MKTIFVQWISFNRLDTDNRVRFHAIRHIFKYLEFLHSDKHVQQLYANSTELFKSFEEGYE